MKNTTLDYNNNYYSTAKNKSSFYSITIEIVLKTIAMFEMQSKVCGFGTSK